MSTHDLKVKNVRVNLCDSVVEAQFHKYNLVGFNIGKIILVDTFPYKLVSTIVLQATLPAGQIHCQFFACAWLLPENRQIAVTPPYELPETECETPLVVAFPIHAFIATPGTLNFRAELDGVECVRHEWTIEQGEAPNIGRPEATVAISAVLLGTSDPVSAILRSASRELTMVDNYLTVSALLGMRAVIPPQSVVLIVTHPKQCGDYIREKARLQQAFPRLQVRFTASFHDRWVVVNGCHYYHFGHSLKDAGRGSVSRYSQVTSKSEVDEFQAKLAAALAASPSL